MSPLVRDLLVNGFLVGATARTAKKKTAGMGYYATAGALFAMAFIYGIWGFYSFLVNHYPIPVAAGLVSLVLLSVATIFAFIGARVADGHNKKAKIAPVPGNIFQNIEANVKNLIEELGDPIKENPTSALLAAALAGFAAGDHLGERKH